MLHIGLVHGAFFRVAVLLVDVGANIDADVAIGLVQPRKWVALLHIDPPALDPLCKDMVCGDGVARAVVTAQVAVLAVILDTEFEWRVILERHVCGDEPRSKIGAMGWIDQAAVTSQLTEAAIVQGRDSLDLSDTVVMRPGRISQVADEGGKIGGNFGDPHLDGVCFRLNGARPFEHVGVIFMDDERYDVPVGHIEPLIDHDRG